MSKFLPTKDFHVLEITDLSPTEIKKSIKLCKKDRKKFKTVSAQNFVAKHFGIKKGFSDYQRWYDEELNPFLEKHNLLTLENLVDNPKNEGFKFFTYRQISDRLYNSKKLEPQRIFTGYYSDIQLFTEEISALAVGLPKEIVYSRYPNIDLVKKQNQLYALKNLIGDVFIDYETFDTDKYIYQLYNTSYSDAEEKKNYEDAKGIKEILLTYVDDWVEIIPFYNLFFLKGKDGAYDFVFKNLRDETFDTKYSSFYPYLKHTDVSSLFNEEYDFERWLYFGHKNRTDNYKKIKVASLWKEFDEHEAEKLFYKNYSSEEYHQHNIVKDYYIFKKLYKYQNHSKKKHLEGFQKIVNDKEELYVSDIITIEQFETFLEENKDYLESRHEELDKYQPLNREKDKTFPVTVTWFDAVAYCNWLEKKYDVPIRLLTTKEYISIHPYPNGCYENKEYSKLYNRYEQDYQGNVRKNLRGGIFLNDVRFTEIAQLNSPDYRVDFDDLTFSYIRPLKYIQSSDNISFCISPSFGEWLFEEGHTVLPYFMQGVYGGKIFNFTPKSSGKYKYRKIGFRVCYTIKKDA